MDKRWDFVKNDEVLILNMRLMPALFVYFDGKYYKFDSGLNEELGWGDPNQFLHFMNRIVNPLLPIVGADSDTPTLEDVNEFLDISKEPNERGSKFFSKDWIAKNFDGTHEAGKAPVLGPTYRDS